MRRSLLPVWWFFAAVFLLASLGVAPAQAFSESELTAFVQQELRPSLTDGRPGGFAVAVRAGGTTQFFNIGRADETRPVTSDLLFNLGSVGKVFDTALLALADQEDALRLDDPVAQYVVELQDGGDIRRITLRQLASYTSGFVLPQDHPPWPAETYTLPSFLATLKAWKADADHTPGQQKTIYSHAGFVLLHLALERRFGTPFGALMQDKLLAPLGLTATTLPVAAADQESNPRGELPPALLPRAVQGYDAAGTAIGAPGNLQGYYHWLGSGQMYASARDMAVFLTASMGDLPGHAGPEAAIERAQAPVAPLRSASEQALAWEIHHLEGETLVDKNGGLNNASAYIGLIRSRKVGVVILSNRGSLPVADAGRHILLWLVHHPPA